MQFSFRALHVRVSWSDFLWFFHISCVLLHSWIHYLSLSIYSLYLLDNGCCSSTLMLFFTSVCDTTHGHHNVVGSRVFVQQTINIGQKIILMALQRQGNLKYQSFQTLYKEGITSISINVCSSSQLHARTHTHARTHQHPQTPAHCSKRICEEKPDIHCTERERGSETRRTVPLRPRWRHACSCQLAGTWAFFGGTTEFRICKP